MLWQLAIAGFLVLLPFALVLDLHPGRERLDAAGRPLRRGWDGPTPEQGVGDAARRSR
jgi:hypothetical protein